MNLRIPSIRAAITLLILSGSLAIPMLASSPASAFSIGIDDGGAVAGSAKLGWASLIQSTGSQIIRQQIRWCDIAPGTNISKSNPRGTPPSDPTNFNDPAYDWSAPDRVARFAATTGQQTLLDVYCAPKWAEGANRPKTGYGVTGRDAPAVGSWKPNTVALGQFAKALAKRYNGKTVDPLDHHKKLPRVKYFEGWNEVNYKMFLSPQCSKGKLIGPGLCSLGGTIVSPDYYRKMLNAFYSGIKGGQSTAVVVAAGFGPYGSSSYGWEIPPQAYMRQLLCLSGTPASLAKLPSCPSRARFDVISFHPYTFMYTPTTKSVMPDGMALGNAPEVAQTLNFAVSAGTVSPAGQKKLWVTEIGWLTNSPGFLGLASRVKPVSTVAAYTSETMFRLWAAGIDTVIWYGAVDAPGIRGSSNKVLSQGWPGGLYYSSSLEPNNPLLATPKQKVLDAYRFPIFARRAPGGVQLWMRSPCRGAGASVQIEYGKFGRWTSGTVAAPASDGVVNLTFKAPALTSSFRATATDDSGCSMLSPTTPIAAK